MEISIRKFEKNDYHYCEELVNEAWNFDTLTNDPVLNKIFLRLYTKGGLCAGNMNLVAVCQDRVIGFLFGYDLLSKIKPRGKIKLALESIISFNSKKIDKTERDRFIKAVTDHNKNRSALEHGKESEVCLFVVSKAFQGKKVGTRLWETFRDTCIATGVKRIQVETNAHGASSYYEQQGFTLVGNFYSPLHELATPEGQACMYEYICDKAIQT